jgi:hypothetical protein
MSSFADELCHQGLLEDFISFDLNPSTVGDAPATGGVLTTLWAELPLWLAALQQI